MEFIGENPTTGDRTRPLLLLLHGFGADEHDLAGIVPWFGDGIDWVSVRAPLTLQQRGFAWVPLGQPPQPDALRAATEALVAWIDTSAAGRKIVPLGFSQGGLMVTQLLRARPSAFEAGVVLSGFVDPRPQPGDAELAEQRPPVLFGWGGADQIIPEPIFAATRDWLHEHTVLTQHRIPMLGHGIDRDMLGAVAEFLSETLSSQ